MRRKWWILAGMALVNVAEAATSPTFRWDFPGTKESFLSRVSPLIKALDRGAEVFFPIEDSTAFVEGAWSEVALMNVLGAAGPLGIAETNALSDSPLNQRSAHWLRAQGLPRVLTVENSSTVSPWSKGFKAWGLRTEMRTYAEIEASPAQWLDAGRFDVVILGSPGWWGDFANPPAGPSRMAEPVAQALRAFTKAGGSAIFVDISQWDLLKAWPTSLRLAPLGPFKVSKLRALGSSREGGISLAPVGVAAEKLRLAKRVVLFQNSNFEFPDGILRPIYAAFVAADPSGGPGLVAGFAFHPFDQDESLAGRSLRVLLNLVLASGARRLSADGIAAPYPTWTAISTATGTPLVQPTETATVTVSPIPESSQIVTLPVTATAVKTNTPILTATPVSSGRREILLPSEFTPWPQASPQSPTQEPSQVPATRVPSMTATVTRRATPLPAPTFAPTPKRALPTVTTVVAVTPLPAPRTPRGAGVAMVTPSGRSVANALGCLRSSPEPFSEGGSYVFFCLKVAGSLHLSVYDGLGRILWESEWKSFGEGQHQWAFDGLDQKGRPIRSGRYLYQLEARYASGDRESKHGQFNKVAGKR